ncbi:hypothetical protein [Acetivibrio straminisolvens]|jgi:hypothetical protein|uniref:DUF4367 domain-containing protein n=1 Tax=Acetivibrio straminisolvens JCM 21531 TaxID=1294263 RepID=W4V371_9FIRM|nr:hypothetical protein [Acetivibrio straminisolvens]GAE87174.1 hypothetical protein JCM21531_523 [Acetivibrio straminisolvens JCM 21531]
MISKKVVITFVFCLAAAVFTAATKINSFGVHINEKPKTQASADGQNINLAKYDMKYEERTIKDKEEIKERADFKLKEPKFIPEGFKETDSSLLENGSRGKFDKIYVKQFKDNTGRKSIQIFQKEWDGEFSLPEHMLAYTHSIQLKDGTKAWLYDPCEDAVNVQIMFLKDGIYYNVFGEQVEIDDLLNVINSLE